VIRAVAWASSPVLLPLTLPLRKFQLAIVRALKISATAETAEKLPIRTGRFCLFSVICADF
jgi:hypothetical protein